MRKPIAVLVLLFFFLITTFSNAVAEVPADLSSPTTYGPVAGGGIDIDSLHKAKSGLSKSQQKISTDLLRLIDEQIADPYELLVRQELRKMGSLVSAGEASAHGLRKAADDLVYVYIYLHSGSNWPELNEYVNIITNIDETLGIVVAWIETAQLEKTAALDNVRCIRTVLPPITNSGSVVSQGDGLHRADVFRSLSGLNGAGIKTGVISDGVDSWTVARNRGDLPADLTVLRNLVGGDEGTAMLEIIHDLAPGASLYFHDCGRNKLEFNNAINSLVAAGCNIIVDDIRWIAEPFFEDGMVAKHIGSILAGNNVVHISSAGNQARSHYQGLFRSDGANSHDFDSTAGPTFLPVVVAARQGVRIVLQWNDRFGASGNDYDLYLVDAARAVLAYSLSVQNGDDDPLEVVYWSNPSYAQTTVYVAVKKYSGVARTLELYAYDGQVVNYGTAADSIFGHPAVPNVIAVGALNASNPMAIASYSSQGPVTITYPSSVTRKKPDICGIDGVAVTGVGGFPSPFYGTSAAAPHIAAVAALVWSQQPTKNAAEIRSMVLQGTSDLGAPGYEYIYGYGLADTIIAAAPLQPVGLTAAPSDRSVVLSWSANTEPDLAGYQVDFRKTGASTWSNVAVAKTATSYTVSSLINGAEYEFRLRAKDTTGNWSVYSDVVRAVPYDNVPPPVPTGLKVSSVNDGQVALSWTAVSATDLAGYQLDYRAVGEEIWVEVLLGKVTSRTVTGLTNEIPYEFRIRARDTSNNWSAYSAVITGTPVDKTPPAVPTGSGFCW
ncbi:MAG: fibronectin type III domain-containing protein [Bacillota bacterium]